MCFWWLFQSLCINSDKSRSIFDFNFFLFLGSLLNHSHVLFRLIQLENEVTSFFDQFPYFTLNGYVYVFERSLLFTFNRILKSSFYCSIWKKVKVVPVLKKGDPDQISYYRVISIFHIFSKVVESNL